LGAAFVPVAVAVADTDGGGLFDGFFGDDGGGSDLF
jgi:hypothetical protein